LILIVYIAEAHFVERDPNTNEFIDGWPIGYEDYEFPQHKNISDRMKMVTTALNHKAGLSFMRFADQILCDNMDNSFLNLFGAWPDSCFAFREEKLVFKGAIDGGAMYGGGYRLTLFSQQLENYLLEC
jgi:hypothetical protein